MCNKCSLYIEIVFGFSERCSQLSKFFHSHIHLKTKYIHLKTKYIHLKTKYTVAKEICLLLLSQTQCLTYGLFIALWNILFHFKHLYT